MIQNNGQFNLSFFLRTGYKGSHVFVFSCFFDKTGISLKNVFEEKFVDVTTFHYYVVVVFII